MQTETKTTLFNTLTALVALNGRKVFSGNKEHNQYDVIAVLEAYLSSQGHTLSNAEQQGLCHGLSTYFGYMRLTKKSQTFFKLFNSVASIQDVNHLSTTEEITLEKVLNHIRWLQASHHMLAEIGQNTPAQALAVITEARYPVLNSHFNLGALMNLDEFRSLLNLSANHMTLINNGMHAMCVVSDGKNYFLFDSDSPGLDEFVFESADEVYAWLMYQSLGYQLPAEAKSLPDYIPLSLTMLALEKQNPFPSAVKWLAECVLQDPKFIERKNNFDMNALLLNCILNRADIVKLLLQAEQIKPFIDLEFKKIPFTPLIYCCQNGFTEIGLLLLKDGANPNYAPDGHSPLKIAIKNGSYPLVASLLEKGANCDMTDILFGVRLTNPRDGLTPLCEILLGHFRNKKLDENALITTLLEKAIELNDEKAMRWMLSHGGLIKNAVESAVYNNNVLFLDLLLTENKLEKENIDHLLERALISRKYDVAEHLINRYQAVACHGASWVALITEDSRALALLVKLLNHPIDFLSYYRESESLGVWVLQNKNNPSLAPYSKEMTRIIDLMDQNSLVECAVDIQLKIRDLISQLEIECCAFRRSDSKIFKGYFDYRGKRASEKINALISLLYEFTKNPTKPISETAEKIKKEYPSFFSGLFRQRERDLVNYIEERQREYYPQVPRTK